MQEGDSLSLGSKAGLFVYQLQAGNAAALESGVEVVHREADMVNSRPAFGDEPGDRRLRIVRLQQLDQGLSGREARDASSVRVFEVHLGQPEHITEEGHGLRESIHRDSDVRYPGPTRG